LYPPINKSEVFNYFVKFKLPVEKKKSPLVSNNFKRKMEENIPPCHLKIFLSNMRFFIISLALIPLSKIALLKGNITTLSRWGSLCLLNLGCAPNFRLNPLFEGCQNP